MPYLKLWKQSVFCLGVLVLISVIFFVSQPAPSCYSSGLMLEDIYVWQRQWDGKVQQSLKDHGHSFRRVLALHTEVAWSDKNKPISHVPLDFDSLRHDSSGIGLVLRLGPYTGRYERNDSTVE